MGVDPLYAADEGIFAMPLEKLARSAECFSEFYIGHNRGDLGYKADWFDAMDMDEDLHRYKVEIPRKEGTTLYFNVESYYPGIVPTSCTTGAYTYTNIMDKDITVQLQNPVVYWAVFKRGTRDKLDFNVHADSYANPIIVVDYQEGDVFEMDVQYEWFDSPARDYTVSVYAQENLTVRDADRGNTREVHADGTSPSEFSWWVEYAAIQRRAAAGAATIASLADVFANANGVGSFLELLFGNLWTLFVWA